MGLYILGIPIVENAAEADKRRNDRTHRKEIEEASDVARWTTNSQEAATKVAYRNLDGSAPGEAIVETVGRTASDVAGAYFGRGGGQSAPAMDSTTMLLIGGGLLAVFLISGGK